ncbi:MAG TPA: efflux transporter outer membrane subunit [Thermoanaerobaculia bacterium]|nr:efflux transporter outer membrane subunit [Thermoanaerobaculia bacterium]
MVRRIVMASAVLLSGACAVGPDYQRPPASVPASYKELAPPGATGPDSWKPAEPRDDAPRGMWWEIFGDPILNGLEARIDVSNQNLALAEAQFRGARAAVLGARADLFPTLATAPSAARSSASTTAPGAPAGAPRTTGNNFQVPLGVAWEADVWGRIRRNVEGSVATAQASAADLEAVRLSLHAELALDYFQLRGADAERRLLETNVAAYEKALQLTVNRYRQGVVSGVDVALAQTQLETTRAQATDLRITRAQLEHAIAILVGKPPADFTLAPESEDAEPPAVPVGLPSELLERRPDIAAAERQMAAANAQIGVATAAFFPRLLLSAAGGLQSMNLANFVSAPNLFWSVGAALAETLFDGGKRRSVKEQALAAYDGTVAAYRADVLAALAQVEDSLAALRILSQEEREQAAAVAAARRSVTMSRNRYEGGVTTYLEVVTAQAAALSNERVAVDIRTRQMTASVNLIKALGGVWNAPDRSPAPSAGPAFP